MREAEFGSPLFNKNSGRNYNDSENDKKLKLLYEAISSEFVIFIFYYFSHSF